MNKRYKHKIQKRIVGGFTCDEPSNTIENIGYTITVAPLVTIDHYSLLWTKNKKFVHKCRSLSIGKRYSSINKK